MYSHSTLNLPSPMPPVALQRTDRHAVPASGNVNPDRFLNVPDLGRRGRVLTMTPEFTSFLPPIRDSRNVRRNPMHLQMLRPVCRHFVWIPGIPICHSRAAGFMLQQSFSSTTSVSGPESPEATHAPGPDRTERVGAHPVRLGRRRGFNEKGNADQRTPAGREPDCHR